MCLSRPTYLRGEFLTEAKIEEHPTDDACYPNKCLTKRQLRRPSTNASDHTLASVTSRRNQTKTTRKILSWHQLCGRPHIPNYCCEGPLRQMELEDEDSEEEDITRRVNVVSEDEDSEDEPDEYDAQKCIMQPVFITFSPTSTKLAL
mmetsp:Transcript_3505/g.5833  ORF Transcript_3505/g.5833 Transcript_3505/m.5833 type:complete len:147 (-) Transcript_3505:148-588(-)